MSDIATKLDEARALIEKGWTRGTYCRDGRYCLSGAIKQAFTGSVETTGFQSTPLGSEVAELIVAAIGHREGLWAFNDRQGSKRPVVAVLKRAAELARAAPCEARQRGPIQSNQSSGRL